jgi:hypothetical protein
LTGFNHGITGATIETAALLTHEKTFCACFNRLTEHGPSLLYAIVSEPNLGIKSRKSRGITFTDQIPGLKPHISNKSRKIFQPIKSEIIDHIIKYIHNILLLLFLLH